MTAKELYQQFKESDFSTRWSYNGAPQFRDLLGKTIVDIYGAEDESDAIALICDDGSKYLMYHEQDCCEDVRVNDICGDVSCLLNTPLTKAEEVVDSTMEEGAPATEYEWQTEPESYTWTFYHLATVKGYVTIRWYGESNGYYSESVDFVEVP